MKVECQLYDLSTVLIFDSISNVKLSLSRDKSIDIFNLDVMIILERVKMNVLKLCFEVMVN